MTPADADVWGQLLLFKLRDRSWDFDVLSPLQPLLTVDQVVNTIHQSLHQLHLNVQAQKKLNTTNTFLSDRKTKIFSHL